MTALLATADALLTAGELRELVGLAGRVRGRAGEAAGTSSTARLGRGYELHGHDPFRPGDDPRAIDWRARLRTGELWVRRHRVEGDGGIRIVVDDSASMTAAKRHLAARLAAALAVVAGAAALPVAIDALGTAGRGGADRARLDAGGARRALARIAGLAGGGRVALLIALERARRAVRADEQVVLLTDLADPAPPDELAAAVVRLARRVSCVHLVDAADAALGADVDELRCAEAGHHRRLDDAAAATFAARVAAWRERCAVALHHRGVPLVVVDAARPARLVDVAGELVASWG